VEHTKPLSCENSMWLADDLHKRDCRGQTSMVVERRVGFNYNLYIPSITCVHDLFPHKMSERELKRAYQSLIRVKSAIKESNDDEGVDSQSQDNLITFGPEFEEPVTRLLQSLKSKLDSMGPKVRIASQ